MPWKSPTPLTSPTKSYLRSYYNFCLKYAPVYLAFYCSFCHSITSSTALAAVTANGLPPYVLKYSMPLFLKLSATSLVQITAETGKPLPIAFPTVIMSGITP